MDLTINSPYDTILFKELKDLDWFAVKDVNTPYQKLPPYMITKDTKKQSDQNDCENKEDAKKEFNSMRIQTCQPVYLSEDTKVIYLEAKLDLTPKQPETNQKSE